MPFTKSKFSKKNKTRNYTLQNKPKIKYTINGTVSQENIQGWKTIHIWGEPFERGFAHGVLLHKELARIKKSLPFMVTSQVGVKYSEYMTANKTHIIPIVKQKYPEYYEEICGISAGAKYKNLSISTDIVIAWNALMTLYSFFNEGKQTQKLERCSAFIATGNATKKGDIVMAHNTHTDLVTGQLLNIVLHVSPTKGHEFVMQTSAGLICSMSDC